MKKIILSIAIMAVFLAFSTAAHAAEMLEKDYGTTIFVKHIPLIIDKLKTIKIVLGFDSPDAVVVIEIPIFRKIFVVIFV